MEEDKNLYQKSNFGSKPENLPHARAGHRYQTQIGRDYISSNSLAVCWLDGVDATGLHFFPDKQQIFGIPKNSGSFDLQLNIREYSESGVEELSTHALRLIVEDDYDFQPEETDESDPYWKTDDDVFSISVNRGSKIRLKKDVAAASRRGRQHIEEGKIREDDCYVQYNEDTRWYVLAVADGSGKSEYSRKGSEIACRSAVESCLEQLTSQSRRLRKSAIRYIRKRTDERRKEVVGQLHEIIAASVTNAYEEIAAEATKLDRRPEDFATTLLMCICKKFEFGWLIGAFGAGDGAVCAYDKENRCANLLAGGESPSKKCFLTTPGIFQSSELERRIRFTIVDDFTALFLMTNGVSHPKFGDENNLQYFELWNRFRENMYSEVKFSGNTKDAGKELLDWLDFPTSGKYDDRTVAVVF